MGYYSTRRTNHMKAVDAGKADTDGRMDLTTYRQFLLSDFWKRTKEKHYKHSANNQCHLCKSKRQLQVHHIVYRGMFKPDMTQLITLCDECHKRVEKIPWKLRNTRKAFKKMRLNVQSGKPMTLNLNRDGKTSSRQRRENYYKTHPQGMFTWKAKQLQSKY